MKFKARRKQGQSKKQTFDQKTAKIRHQTQLSNNQNISSKDNQIHTEKQPSSPQKAVFYVITHGLLHRKRPPSACINAVFRGVFCCEQYYKALFATPFALCNSCNGNTGTQRRKLFHGKRL